MQKESKYKTTDIFLAAVLHYHGFHYNLEKVDDTVIFVFDFLNTANPKYATYKNVDEALEEYEGDCLVIQSALDFKECHEKVRGELYDLVKGKNRNAEKTN